jgi:hypothetical protein
MLKTTPIRQAIALGFALLVIAWLASLPSPSCEPPKPSGKAEQTSNNLKKDCPTIFGAVITYIGHFIHDNRDEITASSTVIIAFFTAILGVYTVRLAKSTRIAAIAAKDSANVAKDSLVIATRPRISIPAPALCEANERIAAQHISFCITNGGGIAIIDRVDATVQATRGRGGMALTKSNKFFPLTINREIEAGQSLGEYWIALDWIGAPNLHREINSGEATLKIIFQIIANDMFGKNYPPPTIPFDFDHRKWVFEPSRLLQPEKE